jgi:hypothetical protein
MLGVSGNNITGTKAPHFDGSQPCRSLDTEVFYPEDEDPAVKARKTKAAMEELKPLCSSCAFSSPCLEWALKNNEYGIWAGTTEADRKMIKRQRNFSVKRSETRLKAVNA